MASRPPAPLNARAEVSSLNLLNDPRSHLLTYRYLWIPTGEDNTGINDRHWLASRADAENIFRRWDALIGDLFIGIFFATSKVSILHDQ